MIQPSLIPCSLVLQATKSWWEPWNGATQLWNGATQLWNATQNHVLTYSAACVMKSWVGASLGPRLAPQNPGAQGPRGPGAQGPRGPGAQGPKGRREPGNKGSRSLGTRVVGAWE